MMRDTRHHQQIFVIKYHDDQDDDDDFDDDDDVDDGVDDEAGDLAEGGEKGLESIEMTDKLRENFQLFSL